VSTYIRTLKHLLYTSTKLEGRVWKRRKRKRLNFFPSSCSPPPPPPPFIIGIKAPWTLTRDARRWRRSASSRDPVSKIENTREIGVLTWKLSFFRLFVHCYFSNNPSSSFAFEGGVVSWGVANSYVYPKTPGYTFSLFTGMAKGSCVWKWKREKNLSFYTTFSDFVFRLEKKSRVYSGSGRRIYTTRTSRIPIGFSVLLRQ